MARILDRHTFIINDGSAAMAHRKDEHGVRDRGRRRLILVVDDNAAICDMLSWALELAGYRASAIPGGESALTWIDTAIQSGDSPTLILLDLSLETKRAAYLCCLRARWKTTPPPIIVLTTSKEIDDELAGERVVQKPFHVRDLLIEVHKVLPPFSEEAR